MSTVCADIRRALCRKCAGLGIPVSGIFELTPRCNLRCKMCYVRLTPEQMPPIGRERTAAEWLELGHQARSAGLAFLLITGGEPMLRSDFCEIYEGLTQLGLSISINTNGTMLTPQIWELWHRSPPAQVNITLYGTSRADYDALCQNPDAFDAVTEALDWLKQEGILIHLNTTIVPTNYHKWVEIEEFAKARGLDLRMTAYCFPPNRRDCSCFERLSPEQAGELIVQDAMFREGPAAIKARARDLDTPLPRSCELDNGEPMQCLAGRSQYWITWNGTMTPCAMLTQPAVHPFTDGFTAAWAQLQAACEPIRLCPECTDCPDRKSCMNCAAVTFSETGRFDGKPEYMCRMNRAYREAVQKLAETI